MPAPYAVRLVAFVGLAATAAVACTDESPGLATALTTGAINVTVSSIGAELDPDGYRLMLDSAGNRVLAANDSAMIANLPARIYTVSLEGLASNCQIAESNPRRVSVSGGRIANVRFTITCVQYTGTIRVTTATTGTAVDPNGYIATVTDHSLAQTIGVNGSVTFAQVPGGQYTVALEGVASNCTVDDPQLRSVTVTPGVMTAVAFAIHCTAPGSVRVIATTSGVDFDPTGYSVRIAAQRLDTAAALATNSDTTIGGIPAGNAEVTLGGVSPNCDVAGTNRRAVAVASGGTVELRFDVVCEAATPLAFVGERGGNLDIYRINSNSVGATRLTTHSSVDQYPAWSPDGAKIVFTSARDGNAEIYVMNADGTNPLRLTSHQGADYLPAWSPDGAKIVFTSARDGNAEIYVMNADGTNPVRLTNHGGSDSDPAWSPNGQKIAFLSDRDGENEIYVMNPDGSNATAVTSNGAQEWSPAWSPDGGKIAFSSGCESSSYYYYCQYHLFVMNADGSAVVQLTDGACDEYDPAWSPDGRWIAFTSTRPYYGYEPCPTSVMVIKADGTGIVELTNGGASAPAWKP